MIFSQRKSSVLVAVATTLLLTQSGHVVPAAEASTASDMLVSLSDLVKGNEFFYVYPSAASLETHLFRRAGSNPCDYVFEGRKLKKDEVLEHLKRLKGEVRKYATNPTINDQRLVEKVTPLLDEVRQLEKTAKASGLYMAEVTKYLSVANLDPKFVDSFKQNVKADAQKNPGSYPPAGVDGGDSNYVPDLPNLPDADPDGAPPKVRVPLRR